jgi:L-amino acid N-acyltransferase YncA
MDYPIVSMSPELWPAVREIYREGIATGNATFETEVPEWETWDNAHLKNCRLVALEPFATDEDLSMQFIPISQARVLGWAALSPVSARRVYAGVAEVSVYVASAEAVASVRRSWKP